MAHIDEHHDHLPEEGSPMAFIAILILIGVLIFGVIFFLRDQPNTAPTPTETNETNITISPSATTSTPTSEPTTSPTQ